MTNSIVWDLKKSWNEKGTHFCYKIHENNLSNRNATGYKWVLVLAQHVTNTHLYHVALRFHEFFHGIFKTPQITNGNLIIAVLLVESNTMVIGPQSMTSKIIVISDSRSQECSTQLLKSTKDFLNS